MFILGMLVGIIIGSAIGVILMAIMQINRDEE